MRPAAQQSTSFYSKSRTSGPSSEAFVTAFIEERVRSKAKAQSGPKAGDGGYQQINKGPFLPLTCHRSMAPSSCVGAHATEAVTTIRCHRTANPSSACILLPTTGTNRWRSGDLSAHVI
jgi:hypothetical protein|mmetsp:Transcript_96191/g.161736  ORF Transcript_96191/g.161736 Transcript_96191/m.161736 type:complete len:119 (+) Transcript_96191:564-920(+)